MYTGQRLLTLNQSRALSLQKRLLLAPSSAKPFSSDSTELSNKDEAPPLKPPVLKATSKAGYKMPRLKKGERVVSFRPSGHTSLAQPTRNFNFNMAREE